ncbi:DUF5665 domain-containing protein [Brevibacillus sp. SYSU BS000544]|uniref:DUF5665 domain-containing protein n=1 Tax=Brevibacillus sp. SYSU BS000544 TaxID=3416443 RepID=UPI003CE4E702
MTQPPSSTKELMEKLDVLITRLDEIEQFTHRIDRLSLFIKKTEIADILLNYTKPRRLFFTNFLAGLARGLGLTLGTAIVLVLLGSVIKQFISVPIIGDYIAQIVDYVNSYYVR